MSKRIRGRERIRKITLPVAGLDDTEILQMHGRLRKDTEGEFRIERQLGKGGMAVVYLATEIALDRQVAIKVLPQAFMFGEGVERFQREAKMAASLDHPNIIPVFRISSGSELFWYAMRYVEGVTLGQYLREESRCTLSQTIEILAPMADALDFAHHRGVVHRDMKPSNVMLDSSNRVVVTDFGIAKAASDATLTLSGVIIGTPSFMSPEQAKGAAVAGASDQYAVGTIAYRMLSGQIPFETGTPDAIIAQQITVDPPPLDVLCPGLPTNVHRAVHRALAKQPEDRWPSITAFVEALKTDTLKEVSATPPRSVQIVESPPIDPGPVEAPADDGSSTTRPEPESQTTRRWSGRSTTTAGIGLAGIVVAGLMFSTRAGTASVRLDELHVEGLTMVLADDIRGTSRPAEPTPITQPIPVVTLWVAGQDSIAVPPTDGRVRQTFDATTNVELRRRPGETGTITLQQLQLASETTVELGKTELPGEYRIRLRGVSTPIHVAMTGSILLAASGRREVLDFPVGSEPVLVWPDSTAAVDLVFELARPALLAQGVRINDLALLRRESDPVAEQPRIDTLSTVISGRLRIGDVEDQLGLGEELLFGSFDGVVRRLELTDSAIVMFADGNAVSGIRIGFREPQRNLMPIHTPTRLAGMGVGVLAVVGLIYAGVQSMRRES